MSETRGEPRETVERDEDEAPRGGTLPTGEQPVCAICGAAIRPDDVICPNCGTELVGG